MQLHYALRFEANDDLHRVIKAGHILLYVYVGATSGGWDLGILASNRGPTIEDEVAHGECHSDSPADETRRSRALLHLGRDHDCRPPRAHGDPVPHW